MISKKNIWFLTLFSIILILGIYYVTIPNDLLEKINIKEKIENNEKAVVNEDSSLNALRVSKETSRQEKIESIETSLTDENLTTEEKNNSFELLKYLNEIQGLEEKFEKKIKKELNLDCYTKIDNQNVEAICVSNKHDKSLANKVMRIIQSYYNDRINISVKFQNK